MKINQDVQKSLEGISEEELKKLLRNHYRAKHEREKTPAFKPMPPKLDTYIVDSMEDGQMINPEGKHIDYRNPRTALPNSGRESYAGHKSKVDKMGYMPLLDRLLQMQRAGESLHEFRAQMAEYNLELRKEMEAAKKLHADEWPTALPVYAPDVADAQEMQRRAQYKVAARMQAIREEKYRSQALSGASQAKPEAPSKATETPPAPKGGSKEATP
nr:MAG: hypothetical protein [Microvirus sp.]